MHDQFSFRQKIRALTFVDIFSREYITIEVGQCLKGEHVVQVLKSLGDIAGHSDICLQKMTPSSRGTQLAFGPIITESKSTSHGLGRQPALLYRPPHAHVRARTPV